MTERKLEALRHCLQRLRSRRPVTAVLLAADEDLQDLLVLNLSRAVQLCVDIAAHRLSALNKPIPATMGETFTQLAAQGLIDSALADRLKRAVGFRNIAVHSYEVMDWDIVHALTGEPLWPTSTSLQRLCGCRRHERSGWRADVEGQSLKALPEPARCGSLRNSRCSPRWRSSSASSSK